MHTYECVSSSSTKIKTGSDLEIGSVVNCCALFAHILFCCGRGSFPYLLPQCGRMQQGGVFCSNVCSQFVTVHNVPHWDFGSSCITPQLFLSQCWSFTISQMKEMLEYYVDIISESVILWGSFSWGIVRVCITIYHFIRVNAFHTNCSHSCSQSASEG